ncbi:MAG: T9SS type A sorting domain-containing protein [Brumimicrobium sp.]
MKQLYFFILFCTLISNLAITQIVPSDCDAHDSIIEQYSEDAQRLTLDRIFEHNYTYVDSVIIPSTYSDTVLNALVAIHNAVGIQERDTVVDMLDIHSNVMVSMNNFYLAADSTLSWMENLSNGNLNTGQPILDEIISDYDFYLYDYYVTPGYSYSRAMAIFVSNENFNLKPITDTIETIPFVYYADQNAFSLDASTIYDTIFPTHVELTFNYGWGDCPSGCTGNRYWKFNVYYDCSVEFVESYGGELPPNASVGTNVNSSVSIYPNPVTSKINIDGIENSFSYSFYDLKGNEVLRGHSNSNMINLNKLEKGIYIISIKVKNEIVRKKIIKL